MKKITHEHLLEIVKRDKNDYEGFGDIEFIYGDCSSGCKWYIPLKGKIGMDWGVCSNSNSHRCGLLTFEHQGCSHYE